jgi:hypothetical protein
MDLSSLVNVDVTASGQDLEPRRWVMCEIPLDLQRKFERRWAARFAQPVPPKKQELEGQDQQPATSAESKRKTRRVEAAEGMG